MAMDSRGLVWKRVWKMTFFGLKQGQDLGYREAHPHQEFPWVPLPEDLGQFCAYCTFTVYKKCFCKIMKKISSKCYRGALNMIILFGGFCRHRIKTWKARLAQLFKVSFHVHPLPFVSMPKFVFNFNDTLESRKRTLSVKNFGHLEEREPCSPEQRKCSLDVYVWYSLVYHYN